MCEPEQPLPVARALLLLERALDALNAADHASLPVSEQADVLRGLERAEAKQTAARALAVAAFSAQGGFEHDGQGSTRSWLRWQTRVTGAAAGGAVAWARRLASHPGVAAALAAAELSASWARQICDWSDLLPESARGDADEILLGAVRAGVDLPGLAGLAREMYERSRRDQPDAGDDGFGDRCFRLGITFRGAGRAEGDLTPGCAAALSAVLEALGKKAGPQDTRTAAQRRHDALEEACRRLIAAGMLPARAGQPTQIQVHLSLAQLRGLPGAAAIEQAWLDGAAGRPGFLTGAAAEGAACDATLVPTVTGHLDWSALDRLADLFLAAHSGRSQEAPPGAGAGQAGAGQAGAAGCPNCHALPPLPPATRSLPPATRARLRRALLALAIDALSGPAGLAAALRANPALGPLATPSLPLDIGTATDAIPAHLRRAALLRHPRCAYPGCRRAARDIHHIVPRSRGGPTALWNLAPLCEFHHLIVIHRWGWQLRLNPDGTTTAVGPDGRTYDSHGPPGQAA